MQLQRSQRTASSFHFVTNRMVYIQYTILHVIPYTPVEALRSFQFVHTKPHMNIDMCFNVFLKKKKKIYLYNPYEGSKFFIALGQWSPNYGPLIAFTWPLGHHFHPLITAMRCNSCQRH